MHELPAAEIDADVRVPPPPFVEEHQVSPPQARHPNAGRGASLLLRVARQCHAGLPEAVLYEPAAIETLSGRRATEAIGLADHPQRLIRRAGATLIHARHRRARARGERKAHQAGHYAKARCATHMGGWDSPS